MSDKPLGLPGFWSSSPHHVKLNRIIHFSPDEDLNRDFYSLNMEEMSSVPSYFYSSLVRREKPPEQQPDLLHLLHGYLFVKISHYFQQEWIILVPSYSHELTTAFLNKKVGRKYWQSLYVGILTMKYNERDGTQGWIFSQGKI